MGHPENALGMSRINLPGTPLERQIKTAPGRHFRTSRGRPRPTSPGRLLKILFDRPDDVPIWRPGDVLIWRPVFAGWEMFQIFVAKGDTDQFFCEIIVYEQYNFY